MFAIKKSAFLVAVLLILGLLLSSCAPPPQCSAEFLIWSINNANNNGPGTDTIDLASGCTYELGVVDNTIDGHNGTPTITSTIIINGNGAMVRRSTGAQKSAIRLFHVSQGGDLTLNNIVLYDGLAMNPPDTTPEIPNSGGAIYNAGTVLILNSTLDYNRAMKKGGGIYNLGNLTVRNSTLMNNEVNISNAPGESGGAIHNQGTAVVDASTIVGNIASQSGGGIANGYGGNLAVVNSTISGNSTTLSGLASGAAIMSSGDLSISYSTIASNVGISSGAVWSATDTMSIFNSIIANNLPQNCSYPATSLIHGDNLDNDGSCDGFTINDDPLLDPLANNGGPTLTHAFHPSSPAKNAASGFFPPMDQRNEPRPHGSAADLGSLELGATGGYTQNPATLAGVVWHDQNGDGINDPGESPFVGVEVVMMEGTCVSAGPTVALLSQADGTYQFFIPSPNAGTYCVSIDPLVEPNTSLLIPGGFIIPSGGEYEVTITEGQALTGLDFGWQFQFDNIENPLMEITTVHLDSTTIHVNTHEEVEVTVTNIGTGDASGFELVLVPQYGDGPPNPAGYELLPEMAPGASHTVLFSPGIMYSSGGSYTLRTLVTDSWYTLGDADHVGLYGSYEDTPITVTEYACPEFKLEPIELVFLNLPGDTRILPLYVKFSGPVPEDLVKNFQSHLGELVSYRCGFQGFDDRVFCMTEIPEGDEGTEVPFLLTSLGCLDWKYELPAVQIPVPKPITPTCSIDLNEKDCAAAGGKYSRASECVCP